jgi:dTDP-L-rhamnose 4-epimerase
MRERLVSSIIIRHIMNILITGGAGFIGSHLAKKLVSLGHDVTILDNLSNQVHGRNPQFPSGLTSTTNCVLGDICDRDLLATQIVGKEAVIHLAAETGTAQSMYEVQRYTRVNLQGTATLLDIAVNSRPASLQKIVVASSRAIYGEGKYRCPDHGIVYPNVRTLASLSIGRFEPNCPNCDLSVHVLPTSEDSPCKPSSFYGLTKQVQEQMVLMFGKTLGVDAIALRYQNVFGPGQSLSNPYTGLLAVFSTLVRQNKPLSIFEDGHESRDFIYIDDVVDATIACVLPEVAGIHSLNVGSGVRTSVLDVATAIRRYFHSDTPIEITGAFRAGDIRHNVADISLLKALTGFNPKWNFVDGLNEFLSWTKSHTLKDAGFEQSIVELRERGLFVGSG